MIIDYNTINNLNIMNITDIFIEEFIKESGKEHYKLLSYLSTQYNNSIIIDIGTHKGYSALALSSNKTNTIHTFDIIDKINEKNKLWQNNNVYFHNDDLMDNNIRNKWETTILNSSMIFLDIDPHDGKLEYEFYNWLKDNNYKGILICDDIWYFKGMRDNFWYHIPNDIKYDVTHVGHFSGTGIIVFNNQDIILKEKYQQILPKHNSYNKNWTIVTAYFNLTKTPDASNEIKQRDIKYYMSNANMTMSIDQNLVVYCDKESYETLKEMRPKHLHNKTQFIIIEFMDINIVKLNYEKIVNSRQKTGYNSDSRNTPSYYLFCMARYDIMINTIENNPFNSTHFAWCNICIERMSWKNMIYFPKIWEEYRDKFSTCYIDYQPKTLVIDNPKEYYKYGRCSMCSGFFTGNKQYMYNFCISIIQEFYNMLNIDCGHADEQLFSIVYFKNPELFEFYYGDYTEMIVNYGWIIDRPYEPIKNIMTNLYKCGENWQLLYDCTSRWLMSYNNGCFKFNEYENDKINYEYVKYLNIYSLNKI